MSAYCSTVDLVHDDYPTELDLVSEQLWLAQQAAKAGAEEIKAAYEHIKTMEADFLEFREYLERYVDVVDGSYGEAAPNRAMQLVSLIDERLYGIGAF